MLVALPDEVIGPVRLALVVTVPALVAVVAVVAFPVNAPANVGAVTVPVNVGEALIAKVLPVPV